MKDDHWKLSFWIVTSMLTFVIVPTIGYVIANDNRRATEDTRIEKTVNEYKDCTYNKLETISKEVSRTSAMVEILLRDRDGQTTAK